MKNVLEQLYNGEIFPAEQYAPKSEEHRKIYQGNYKHYEDFIELLSKLNPPLDKRFIEIMDEQLDVIPYEFSEMFIDGFQMWVRRRGQEKADALTGRLPFLGVDKLKSAYFSLFLYAL